MGVPAFFKWLQRRYPVIISNCIERRSDHDSSKPNPNTEGDREFDCLYLDMNGIIHPCFHPEGLPPPKNEEEVFENVDKYILRLFNIVRPRLILYMAIDGVAPRAKMNQQRMRRYRSAKDNAYKLEKMKFEAQRDGLEDELKELNDPDYLKNHDSNVITPGSPFFQRLTQHLKEFISKQQKEDPGWKKIMVILSDASVPGEGEHKIMSFIRSQRVQPGYEPNRRHVIYGLDADLIFLGLASHEPYFTLLRENVIDTSAKNPEKGDIGPEFFHFVSLWVLRQYLNRDLRPPGLRFEWNLENALDDFILLCFAAGNDFLPGLPGFSIHSGAIQAVISTYRRLLPVFGYLTQNGGVNVPSFSQVICEFDKGEARGLETILYPSKEAIKAQEYVNSISNTDNPVYIEQNEEEDTKDKKKQRCSSENKHKVEEMKPKYYNQKFGFNAQLYKSCVSPVVTEYTRGMIWILNYYLHGVPSWNWYYPYQYAPCASDFKSISLDQKNYTFDLSEPFKPLVQLMAVLPPQSAHALPDSMKKLMTDPKSELIEFYPTKFTVDLCGGTAIWHGIVNVPFIDEKKLNSVLESMDLNLTPEEALRNKFGDTRMFIYKDSAPPKNLKDEINLNGPTFGKIYRLKSFDYDNAESCEFIFEHPKLVPGQFMSYLNMGVILPPSAIEIKHNLDRYDAFYDRGTIADSDTIEENFERPLQIPGYIQGTTMDSRAKLVQKMKYLQSMKDDLSSNPDINNQNMNRNNEKDSNHYNNMKQPKNSPQATNQRNSHNIPNQIPQQQFPNQIPQQQFPGQMQQQFPNQMQPQQFPNQMQPQQFPNQMPPQQFPNQMPPQQFPNQMPPQQFPNQMPPQQFPNQMPPQQFPNQMPLQQFPNQMPLQQFPNQMQRQQFPNQRNLPNFPNQMPPQQYPNQMLQQQFPNQKNIPNFPNQISPQQFPNQPPVLQSPNQQIPSNFPNQIPRNN